ncbi:hypothetical protein H0H81_004893 [Sphagnurus paluster]|uniref:Uncharacterized protein n=1 Tax=Sphagnurus paluster TaxID=117069 RepID=A0A9P7FRT3_9AGAR|nr:hypothetical protein H0H81_004893 [Sphagnurus paluster]
MMPGGQQSQYQEMDPELELKPFKIAPELEDLILEWCVHLYPLRKASTFARISKRTQKRVEPIIYRTIKLSGNLESGKTSHHLPFLFCIRARPKAFFARHVVNLMIEFSVPDGCVPEILEACTGVRNLALLQWNDRSNSLPSLMRPLCENLTSLSAPSRILGNMAAAGLVCPNVRQMTIFTNENMRFPPFDWLPNLKFVETAYEISHLYSNGQWLSETRQVLAGVPNLRGLSVRVWDSTGIIWRSFQDSPEIQDRRVSVRYSHRLEDLWWDYTFHQR